MTHLQNVSDTMTSIEIAEIAEKRHADVLTSIKKMEPTWLKIGERNFSLAEYEDKQGKKRPMYILDRKETLFVISKYNDEVRGKIILRWEELEKQNRKPAPAIDFTNPDNILKIVENWKVDRERAERAEEIAKLQQAELEKAAPKVEYCEHVLLSKSTYNTSQIAKELDLSAKKLNDFLKQKRVQFKQNNTWLLYTKYTGKGYTETVTYSYESSTGDHRTSMRTVWTEKGRKFIHELFNENLSA